MTISLTVILVEVTDDIDLLLPIMFTILAAKIVGDKFTRSIYEIHIELSGVFMQNHDQLDEGIFLAPAKSIMTYKVVMLREIETIDRLDRILAQTSHNGFAVVAVESTPDMPEHFFVGQVTRDKLLKALKDARGVQSHVTRSHVASFRNVPRIDLRKILDRSPYVVHELMPLYRVSRLFRSMGLRTLFVVDSRHCVVGVITRADIAKASALGDVKEEEQVAKSQLRMREAHYQVERLIEREACGHRKLSVRSFEGSAKEQSAATESALDAPGHLRRRHTEPSLAVFDMLAAERCSTHSAERRSCSRHARFHRQNSVTMKQAENGSSSRPPDMGWWVPNEGAAEPFGRQGASPCFHV